MAEQARTYRQVTFSGVVQGVGFRPTVARLAREKGVTGWVLNAGGCAECGFCGTEDALGALTREIQARFSILQMIVKPIEPFAKQGFEIMHSTGAPEAVLPAIVPPDAPVCNECLQELNDPNNRRYQHPFISCAACGPRYSIIQTLPYDRESVTMSVFPMCEACAIEYSDADDRRYHAQTIACPHCGPKLWYETDARDYNAPITKAACAILSGGIVAIKGIGGYHLCCLPNDMPVERLRALKGREKKPFALMFHTLDDIESICHVSDGERQLLQGFARPIVLLSIKNPTFSGNVAQGSLDYGCFLPYTPVHHLLLDEVSRHGVRALVMTSANVSGSPLLCDDAQMLAFAKGRLDGVLAHNREIENPLDDSVARVIDGQPQILRRARGYAPLPIPLAASGRQVFAAGGDLKAAFCLLKSDCAYVGPHIGDLEDMGCNERYGQLHGSLAQLLDHRPDKAACDMHPRYFSAEYAQGLHLPIHAIQHHHAHIASVMAEHGLNRVLGVAFDGTGYGTDGTIWGGEFLLCEGAGFQRLGHLLPTAILGGDESMKDGQKTAACYQFASGLVPVDYPDWSIVKRALEMKINTVNTSSMGRLFDAASSILGICQKSGYEGECAILLEQAAELARRAGIAPAPMAFDIIEEDGRILADWRPVIRTLKAGGDVPSLALGFHLAVADMVVRICDLACRRHEVYDVALSGGVFLNRLLLRWCLEKLQALGIRVYVNLKVPPGDGGISLGQAFIASR